MSSPLPSLLLALVAGILIPPGAIQAQQSATVRDSAGIRIVEHRELSPDPPHFRIGERASLDLGGQRAELAEELDARQPFLVARPLSDGRWIVVDRAELKLFDAHGAFVRSIGNPGPGPGEFRQLGDVCVAPGDTLVAISFGDHRVSVFDSTGSLVRSGIIDGDVREDPCFGDGSIVVRHAARANPSSRLPAAQALLLDRVAPVTRMNWHGVVIGSLGLLQVESLDFIFEDLPNIVVANQRVVVGNGSVPEYRVYNGEGRLVQIVRWVARRTAVSDAMRNARIALGYAVGPASREYLPVYFRMLTDAAGRVWLQDYAMPDQLPSGYTVFDRSGRLLGRIPVPEISKADPDRPVQIRWIGQDRLLLVWRDDDGFAHLTIHALVPR